MQYFDLVGLVIQAGQINQHLIVEMLLFVKNRIQLVIVADKGLKLAKSHHPQ